MKKSAYILLIIIQGCTVSNTCVEKNALYLKIKQYLDNGIELNRKAGNNYSDYDLEAKLKRDLFIKICNQLGQTSKMIIIEKVPPFDPQRFGVVFLPDSNKLIYFSQNKKGNLQLGTENMYDYKPINKILDNVIIDSRNKASELDHYFELFVVTDASSLNVFLLDAKDSATKKILYSYNYMPDLIMSEKFDSVFRKSK